MKRKIAFFLTALMLLGLSCTTSTPSARQNDLIISGGLLMMGAQQPTQATLYWTGDGGKGMRLAVLEPEGRGILEHERWALRIIQSSISTDFDNFSNIDVIDRQNLQTILDEQIHSTSGIYSDENRIRIGHLTQFQYLLAGALTRVGNNYSIEFSVTDVETGQRKASYGPRSISFLALENLNTSEIKEATASLLEQLGVELTEQGRRELKKQPVIGQLLGANALARATVAQQQGTEIEALSYLFQAEAFDPSLMEAINRSSILNVNISSGNIGEDTRNDIVWRNRWVARLRETEAFFDSLFNRKKSTPYTLFYSVEIEQGAINYQKQTVALSIETYLHGNAVWVERTLQAVYDGLNATGRKDIWGLNTWPHRGITNLKAITRTKWKNNFSVVFELLNDQGKVIGRQTLQTGGSWELNWSDRPQINIASIDRKPLTFQNVNSTDISRSLTIRAVSVNKLDAGTAARDGILQIRPVTRDQIVLNDHFKFTKGEINGISNNAFDKADFVIPNAIWDEPIFSIGSGAFQNTGLTDRLTIPNGITSIGNDAFSGNRLTGVTIPNGITSIGNNAFSGNLLTNVIIPNSVITIGAGAFSNNSPLSDITIGANVSMSSNSFSGGGFHGFPDNYRQNGKQAGVYNYSIFKFGMGEIQGFADNTARKTNVVIPDTVWGNRITSIGDGAFKNAGLTGLTIPNSITSIGDNAFSGNKLTAITIPASVISIGSEAFSDNRLVTVTVGANVAMNSNSFNGSVFHTFPEHYNLNGKKANTYTRPIFKFSRGEIQGFANNTPDGTELAIPGTIWGVQVTSIGNEAFRNMKLTRITIPNTVTTIGNHAFANNRLTSITFPNSVRSIGNEVFSNNNGLTTITIGAGVIFSSEYRDNSFVRGYNDNGKRAGRYCLRKSTYLGRHIWEPCG